MFKLIFRRMTRQPVFSLAVALFAAVLAVILCHLHRSNQAELQSYQEAYQSVPVVFRVTQLDGSKTSGVSEWVVKLFDDKFINPRLDEYVTSMFYRSDAKCKYTYEEPDESGVLQKTTEDGIAAGITSLYVAEELTEDWGGQVFWHDGFDESMLASANLICLVPESMKDVRTLTLAISRSYYTVYPNQVTKTTTQELQVAGYYADQDNTRLYIPYSLLDTMSRHLDTLCGKATLRVVSEVAGLLKDNSTLGEFKAAAAQWFAAPNPTGEKTPWGRFDFEYYFYALDIDDYMLQNLSSSMKNSIRMNQLASAVVFILSAGAGFLTGFLVIRSRKRELNLMRTMGSSTAAIFAEFSLEQLFCIAIGIALGGSYCLWQPIGRLALFGGIYTAGLTLALVIFLRKNLLTTIKEDE